MRFVVAIRPMLAQRFSGCAEILEKIPVDEGCSWLASTLQIGWTEHDMTHRALLSTTFLASTLAILAFAGWRLTESSSVVSPDRAPAAHVGVATIPVAALEDDAWRAQVVRAIPEAATECGIVSIKNAPASIGVSYSTRGQVTGVEIESSLFGGEETTSCVRKQLETVAVGNLRASASVKVALPTIVPGC